MERITGYMTDDTRGALTSWDGKTVLGTIERVISSRPMRDSWVGERYYYWRVRLTDGRLATMQGFGRGMSASGRVVKG